ncbi:MAG: thioredoxin family protein [Hydrogenophaga sp.]|jgi:peroxiredoxin|uniref:thioredoxin family protein n=1 Tax=Hydrogenophaga sp. TaxID=1904254 RepID=UPI001D9795A4|nr:thioredoxin family protein [Hydrogenophaga sp.]MBW0168679.1 thioredoxin family protein [Hydrogenophaga sp.]MBW0182570.1 thioredoxin family protein [Hydrogenophaga sp.]
MQRRPLLAFAAFSPLGTLLVTPAIAAPGLGQAAPDFTLTDTAGKPVKLSDFKGKTVVLEWNNPGCPFVRKHYQGNMQALQKEATGQGAVWLAINSTRDDSADYQSPSQLGRWMTEQKASPTATLMDEDGKVGEAYGARVTPHMYIVNAQGLLVYAGGIDSIPSARVDDISKATNYVRQGLAELRAGKPVSVATSRAYGCSIKYKNGAA